MRTVQILFIFLIITLFGNRLLYAQKNDSLSIDDDIRQVKDSTVVSYYYNISPFSQDHIHIVDTTLNFFQRYDPLRKDYDIIANTMIVAGPHKNLSFSNTPTPLFSIGENNLFAYYFSPEKIKHYKPNIPYSEVYYTMGGLEQNLLRATLGNQLSERLYLGLDLDVESTIGLFTNQRVSSNQFQINTEFISFNKRYSFYINYIHNKFKFGENGGLVSDFDYEDSTMIDRQVLAVNLNDATNTLKSNYYEFNQYILLGGLPDDTLGRAKFGKLFLNSNLNFSNRIYKGIDTGYYDNYYLDSLKTFDSTNIQTLNAAIGWTNDRGSTDQHFGINTQLNFQSNKYFDGNQSFLNNYLSPQIDVFLRSKTFYFESSLKLRSLMANTSSIDIGNGDLFFNNKLQVYLKKITLFAGLDFYNASPEIKAQHMYSNHFIWDIPLNKQNSLNLNGGFESNGYKINTEIITLNNYVYFDENVSPKQYAGSIGLLKLRFEKIFRFKKFGATAMGLYQSSSNTNYIRIPEFTARASIFFSFPLFKGALIVHPGIDVTYLTSYYADNYNPAIMQFHLQNDKKTDDQIYANAYINFKIKRARVFLSYNHFNTLWGKYNYFLVSHYPQEDAILKIGIAWRFYR